MNARFLSSCMILLLLISISACTDNGRSKNTDKDHEDETGLIENTTSYRYLTSVFLPDLQNVFRHVKLDMPLVEVRELEKDGDLKLADEASNFLHFEQDLNVDTAKGVDYVEVKYIFDDLDRLDIITVNYYIQDSSVNNGLFEDLNTTFNGMYGDYYIDSDGYTVWESNYKRGDTADVSYDIGIRKLVKLNDPGITIEMMRFGTM